MPALKLVGTFVYKGSSPEHDREVRLFRKDDGTWQVRATVMPSLSRTDLTEEEARQLFHGWYERSWKDYGASEIIWRE